MLVGLETFHPIEGALKPTPYIYNLDTIDSHFYILLTLKNIL